MVDLHRPCRVIAGKQGGAWAQQSVRETAVVGYTFRLFIFRHRQPTMTSTARKLGTSVEDYLRGERVSEVKHEYVNGEVYAMVGVRVTHNRIGLNLALWLGSRVSPPCQVFASDVKVRVKSVDEERFYYPDVMVACDGPEQDPYYREQPCLIVEVLSDSTERLDRSDKFFAYRKLPSLREYVLIAQDSHRVEVYRRDTSWDLEVYGAGESLRLECVGDSVSVAALYENAEPETQPSS